MSALFLYDDARARSFQPFALTRPAGEMRAGALLVRERWSRAMGADVAGHLVAPHLAGFEEAGTPPAMTDGVVPAGSWVANARFLPSLQPLQPGARVTRIGSAGHIVAVRVPRDIPVAELADGSADLHSLADREGEAAGAEGWWAEEVWDYIRHLVPMLEADIPLLGAGMTSGAPEGSIEIGSHPVFVQQGADVEPAVCFDTSAGPIFVSTAAHVQAFTRLVGPLFIGAGSTVTTDRIAASSIGDTCKVHGELSNTIFVGHANKGHDGFVGHSILGRWVNLGAGTITSNLKNTYGTVQLWTPTGVRETGLQFLGTLFGDHAKTGIGLTLTTGTVLGPGANVYGSVMPPKMVPPFAWGESGAFADYRLDKFLEVAERMMQRRHVELGAGARGQLERAFADRWTAG